jgi:hypothetical protein
MTARDRTVSTLSSHYWNSCFQTTVFIAFLKDVPVGHRLGRRIERFTPQAFTGE